jgi:hypothetical protein
MIATSVRRKTTSRYTYQELDDFRIILGHVGVPHDLFRSPKGKLFIRFERPIEGDSVALQFRKPFFDHATGALRPAHYRMFIGVYSDEVRQNLVTFERLDDLTQFLGIDPQAVLAGSRNRGHLNRRLQATSIDEFDPKDTASPPEPSFMRRPRAPCF